MTLADVGVIVPAYNEGRTVRRTLAQLRELYPEVEVILVDDGSTDDTAVQAALVEGVRVVSLATNRGYGAALKAGMRECARPILVWFDGDGQHPADKLPAIAGPVLRDELDACFAARQPGSHRLLRRVPGKWVLRFVAQLVARRRIPDLNCGFRAFRARVIQRYLHLLPNGFSASATSTLLMVKRGYRLGYEPIRTVAGQGDSKVRMFGDGLRTIALMTRIVLMFDSLLFFTLLALLQVVPAVVYSAWVALRHGLGIPVLGSMIFISGCLTFFLGMLSAQISEMRQELFELRGGFED